MHFGGRSGLISISTSWREEELNLFKNVARIHEKKKWLYSETWLNADTYGTEKSVRFRQVSALHRRNIRDKYMQDEKISVRIGQVSALMHVRFRQVSLYIIKIANYNLKLNVTKGLRGWSPLGCYWVN